MVSEAKKRKLKSTGLFHKELDRLERGLCPFCGKPIDKKDFKDELSRKEYEISGLCQKCQDETFG